MATVIIDGYGTLLEFIHDQILAIWNAPNDVEEYACVALEQALLVTPLRSHPPHLRRDWAHPRPHLRRDWAHLVTRLSVGACVATSDFADGSTSTAASASSAEATRLSSAAEPRHVAIVAT